MAGNPRENVEQKGFWEGGSSGHGHNSESGGRPNGYPGTRRPSRVGVSTDVEFPFDSAQGRPDQNAEKAKPEE